MTKPFSTRLNFRIHYEDDSIVITGDDIEEIKELATAEIKKRGWKEEDCWSEIL